MIIANLYRFTRHLMRVALVCLLLASACNHPQNSSTNAMAKDTVVKTPVAASPSTPKQLLDTATSKAKDFINPKAIVYTGPATIIYKTKADYYDKVPVTLSDDRTKIVSYPAPTDIYYREKLGYPAKLDSGYLLDNRGINKNVAFLSITYEEYSKLSAAPSLDELMNKVIDKAPLTEMYNMGSRYQYKDIPTDINKIIKNGELVKFKRLY